MSSKDRIHLNEGICIVVMPTILSWHTLASRKTILLIFDFRSLSAFRRHYGHLNGSEWYMLTTASNRGFYCAAASHIRSVDSNIAIQICACKHDQTVYFSNYKIWDVVSLKPLNLMEMNGRIRRDTGSAERKRTMNTWIDVQQLFPSKPLQSMSSIVKMHGKLKASCAISSKRWWYYESSVLSQFGHPDN